MDFIGTGKRLQQGDIGKAAREIGIETAVLLSFLEVEAAGRGFDNSNRPKMLFEPHIFYRQLKGKPLKQQNAVAMGLAYKKWKSGNYPHESYTRMNAAYSLAGSSALMSGSFGLSQIMGFNHIDAGHSNVEDFVKTAMQGEFEQLIQMVTLLKSWNMVDILTNRDFTNSESWRPAAKKWNGGGYAKHGYHIRLANAYIKHSSGTTVTHVKLTVSSVLKIGSKGEAVRTLQSDLVTLGYPLEIDGRFGDGTKFYVATFQRQYNLDNDGFAGPKTLAAIKTALSEQTVDKSPEFPVFDKEPTTGLIAIIKVILSWFVKK